MDAKELEALRFPTGRAKVAPSITAGERRTLIDRIAGLPARLRDAAAGMDDAALDTAYRLGGWTARQVIHHVPDSHMNAYVRFKVAVTENDPAIKTYEEAEWALLADYATPVAVSFDLLTALHARWSRWMSTLPDDAWSRAYVHPQSGRVTLDSALQLYVWHGDHHAAHVRGVKDRTRSVR